MQEKDKILIHEWVYKSLEGEISDAECNSLAACLASDPEAISYYQTCIEINRGLVKIKPILRDSLTMDLCLKEMAAYEKQAEVIEIEQAKPSPEKIQICREALPRHHYKTSKVSLYVAVMSTAALLFLLLYVYINPKPISQEVAILTDSINAAWMDPDDAVKKGERLLTGQGTSALKEGVISLVYDDGVQVVIEAPAEYELLTSTEIALHYGRLFATVSEAGKGFTVRTHNSRIIDLGTEFGVQAGTRGDTELHVFKGMTTLIAGLRNTEKELVQVHAGQARQVDTYNADIKAIQLNQTTFARSIDSQTQSVWRGETTIDLSDTLKGKLTAVHPAPNMPASLDLSGEAVNTVFDNQNPSSELLKEPGFFLPISENPYVNGIFMSSGADGPIALTSDGSIRWNAPAAQVRQKIGLLRFDISSVTGDRNGAVLTLYVRGLIGAGKPVAVYGLMDQAADTWSETKLHYANAPGFRSAPLGRYDFDAAIWQKLGVISFTQEGEAVSNSNDLNLDAFIGQDTNNLLTLALIAENSDPSAEWRFTAKEGDPAEAPSLVFANGSSDQVITTVTGDGADTYLSNDNQYDIVNTTDPHGRETSFRVRNYWKDTILITNTDSFKYNDSQNQPQTCPFRLENRPVGTPANPVIAMKAGAGVTFDLNQMQRRIPENRPARQFSAVCGMPEEIMDDAAALNSGYTPGVNIHVLVDGQERYTAANVNPHGRPARISIPLKATDRYLTLTVTSAGDQRSPFDWGLFVRPQIVFE